MTNWLSAHETPRKFPRLARVEFVRLLVIGWLSLGPPRLVAEPRLELVTTQLKPEQVAVIVNETVLESVRIGEYYARRRGIPDSNLIRVRFPVSGANLPRGSFQNLRDAVLRQTPADVQAYAVAWTQPYRVDCMSITSALAFGFDEAYCSKSCGTTKASPLYGSPSHAPFTDFKMRPAMLLAGGGFDAVKRTIDRGVMADSSFPKGTAYLLKTNDANRSVRAATFDATVKELGGGFRIQTLQANSIKGKKDVLFYFTGLTEVPDLPSLRFLPGAIADHLTSTGGVLIGGSQMSSLRWLEAGATGSYGTVVEPCNHLQKFPLPAMVMWRYGEGDSLLEAYWKSVAWPGEGLFIGEPLARPFAPKLTILGDDHARLDIFAVKAKVIRLEGSASPIGPHQPIRLIQLTAGKNSIDLRLPNPELYYRVVP